MRFRDINPDMMNLPELELECAYQAKRLYRLRKLETWGRSVQPDLSEVIEREGELDMEIRRRYRAMDEIPS